MTSRELLLAKYPDANVTTVRQELDEATFFTQKEKQERHNVQGGAIGAVWCEVGKLALVRRLGKRLHPGLAFIGGTVENEPFDDAFLREVREEAGVEVRIDRLVMLEEKVFVSPPGQELRMDLAVFDSTVLDGQRISRTPEAAQENLIVEVFSYDAVPSEMILGDRAKLDQIIKERGLAPLS